MSNEELLRLAKEANFFVQNDVIYYGNVSLETCLEKFAALVHEAAVRQLSDLHYLAALDIVFFGGEPGNVNPFVICNDTFCYAADGEDIRPHEAGDLVKIYSEYGHKGVTAWVSIKRNQDPLPRSQSPEFFETREAIRTKYQLK